MSLPIYLESPPRFGHSIALSTPSSPGTIEYGEKAYFSQIKPRRRYFIGKILLLVIFLGICALSWRGNIPLNELKGKLGLRHTATKIVYLHTENGLALRPAKLAFATMLNKGGPSNPLHAMEEDDYFVSTRVLCYQILHANETRNALNAPCIVLITPGVRHDKIERLRKDGAIVIPVTSIQSSWAHTDISTWSEMFSKLHLFELIEYDLIAFMDNDVVLNAPLDGIFEDSAVVIRSTKISSEHSAVNTNGTALLPSQYLFAGVPELNRDHSFPPSDEKHDFPNIEYFNAGFFIFQPSMEMFNYHNDVLNTPKSFDASLMEQNMWNEIYHPRGKMPWSRLNSTWNIHYPKKSDVKDGAISVHDKFWFPQNGDMSQYLLSWRWRMHGFYEARDNLMYNLFH